MNAPARAPWLFAAPYAHRGLWTPGGPPENSMAAFAAAHAAGLGVELDVQISADREAMIFHDGKLERMTGAEGPLAARNADDLAKLSLAGSRETMPRLADLLAAFPALPLLVEMKVRPGEEGPLEARTAELLKDRRGPTAVMSFNPATLARFAAHAPHIARGQLTSGYKGASPPAPLPPEDDSGCAVSKPDFLSCNIDRLAAYGRPVAQRLSLPLITWTVRTAAELAIARQHAGAWIFEALPVAEAARPR
ncbi:MAG TPA: glycerophosphodiester phosphodiesterase family protein [Caulobacterales bacterium]|nr:glycerophosphodiester phosphodiesterase family protein [Caulobacterales bacterium]